MNTLKSAQTRLGRLWQRYKLGWHSYTTRVCKATHGAFLTLVDKTRNRR